MRKGSKIIIGTIALIATIIALLAMAYSVYQKDVKLSKYHTSVGEKLLYAKKTSEAMSELEKALELDPRNTHAERVLLDAYLDNKLYDKAIAMQLSQLKSAPDEIWDFKRNKRIGEIYIETNNIKNAKAIYGSLLKKYAKTPGVYSGLIICYEKEGDWPKALEYQKQVVHILQHDYSQIPTSMLKKELQKLSELYKKTGQEELADKALQDLSKIK